MAPGFGPRAKAETDGTTRKPISELGYDNPMERVKPKPPPSVGKVPLAAVPAVPVPDAGQSYHPDAESHQVGSGHHDERGFAWRSLMRFGM